MKLLAIVVIIFLVIAVSGCIQNISPSVNDDIIIDKSRLIDVFYVEGEVFGDCRANFHLLGGYSVAFLKENPDFPQRYEYSFIEGRLNSEECDGYLIHFGFLDGRQSTNSKNRLDQKMDNSNFIVRDNFDESHINELDSDKYVVFSVEPFVKDIYYPPCKLRTGDNFELELNYGLMTKNLSQNYSKVISGIIFSTEEFYYPDSEEISGSLLPGRNEPELCDGVDMSYKGHINAGRVKLGFTTIGSPSDWNLDLDGNFDIVIKNGLADDINISKITISAAFVKDEYFPENNLIIKPGEHKILLSSESNLNLGQQEDGKVFKVDVEMPLNVGSMEYIETGILIGNVKMINNN